jgi:hypothetical protein
MSTLLTEPTPENVLADASTSNWLKRALREALERDPADALNDALALAGILEDRLRTILELDDSD